MIGNFRVNTVATNLKQFFLESADLGRWVVVLYDLKSLNGMVFEACKNHMILKLPRGKKALLVSVLSVQQTVYINSTFACGFCQSDKAAAVYSFRHKKTGEQFGKAYVVVEVVGLSSEDQVSSVAEALRSIKGIAPETVRISYDQKSASFVYDRGVGFAHIAAELEKRLKDVQIKETEDLL